MVLPFSLLRRLYHKIRGWMSSRRFKEVTTIGKKEVFVQRWSSYLVYLGPTVGCEETPFGKEAGQPKVGDDQTVVRLSTKQNVRELRLAWDEGDASSVLATIISPPKNIKSHLQVWLYRNVAIGSIFMQLRDIK